jgi:hypothetical protein
MSASAKKYTHHRLTSPRDLPLPSIPTASPPARVPARTKDVGLRPQSVGFRVLCMVVKTALMSIPVLSLGWNGWDGRLEVEDVRGDSVGLAVETRIGETRCVGWKG